MKVVVTIQAWKRESLYSLIKKTFNWLTLMSELINFMTPSENLLLFLQKPMIFIIIIDKTIINQLSIKIKIKPMKKLDKKC